jgi:hypothetical protein
MWLRYLLFTEPQNAFNPPRLSQYSFRARRDNFIFTRPAELVRYKKEDTLKFRWEGGWQDATFSPREATKCVATLLRGDLGLGRDFSLGPR